MKKGNVFLEPSESGRQQELDLGQRQPWPAMVKNGESKAKKATSISSILPELNWRANQGQGALGVAVHRQPSGAQNRSKRVKYGWGCGAARAYQHTLVEGPGTRQRKGYTCECHFSTQLQENYKRNFILRHNIACNYMLDMLVI